MTTDEQQAIQGFAPGCSLWFVWLLASSLGTGIGWFLGWKLSFLVPGGVATLMIGMTSGLFLGLFQWMVLRKQFTNPGRWVVATVLGWAVGFPLGIILAQTFGMTEAALGLTAGFITGGMLSVLQWSVLRSQVTKAGWWVPACLFGWSSGMLYYRPGPTWMGILYGLVSGIVTGVALVWLLYRPVD
jgi:hypothetical protein